jgi:hypothetical protein
MSHAFALFAWLAWVIVLATVQPPRWVLGIITVSVICFGCMTVVAISKRQVRNDRR